MASKKKAKVQTMPGRSFWRPDQTPEARIEELEGEVDRLLTERRKLVDRIRDVVEERLYDLESIQNDIQTDLQKIAEEEREAL